MSDTTTEAPTTAAPDAPKGKTKQRTAQQERSHRSIVARYGGHERVVAKGWTPLPRTLLRYGAHLKPSGLTPTEIAFVAHLMSFKWDTAKPFPAYKTVAGRMGVSVQYARRLARKLERKQLLARTTRVGRTNQFDLTPLFDRLDAHLQQIEAEKAAKADADAPPAAAGVA